MREIRATGEGPRVEPGRGAPLRRTVCLRRRRGGLWAGTVGWRSVSPARSGAPSRAGTPMWAQSVQSGGHSAFYFHPHFYFLLTEKLGTLAVFFETSESPKPKNKIFLLKKGKGQVDDGRVWRRWLRRSPWSLLSPGSGEAPRTLGIW